MLFKRLPPENVKDDHAGQHNTLADAIEALGTKRFEVSVEVGVTKAHGSLSDIVIKLTKYCLSTTSHWWTDPLIVLDTPPTVSDDTPRYSFGG